MRGCFGPPAAVWQKQKDAELSSGCRVCLTANYTLTVTYCAGRALTFFKSSLPPSLPSPSHPIFPYVRSFLFCSIGLFLLVLWKQGKSDGCEEEWGNWTGRVWSEKDRKGNMISPPAKNTASWQAVDILRLDNQTANVSSCLALLFNRHLLISFALSCLFAGLLACLYFCLVLPPQNFKRY